MPEQTERELLKTARKRGYSKERTNAYVYGGLRKTGWVPSAQQKEKATREAVKRLLKKSKA